MASALQSWNHGAPKRAILDFVARVTRMGGPDYVAPADRIAVFDNDGTLWCEQPVQVQLYFLMDRVRELAATDNTLASRQPFKALLERDMKTLHALGKQGLMELAFATHSGMTEEQFDTIARHWFATARHPKLGRLFTTLVYQPQIELLAFLREHGFANFIVSGGGIDLMRAFAPEAYGIVRHQIIGSSAKLHFEPPEVMKLSALQSFDDRDEKVVNIALHIGQRPILCVGNSDGDLPMLRYTLAGEGARLGLLVHHDDRAREYAYDREFQLSPLSEALDKAREYGICVVSMKADWRTIFDHNAAESAA